MDVISNSEKMTRQLAVKLAKCLVPGDVIALIGELGSGKTVFTKGLAAGIGCDQKEVLSPTFVLMRQYRGRLDLNHFDLYRLKSIRQLEDIGYEEYFYGQAVTVIEWADRIEASLPERHLKVILRVIDKDRRLIKFISNKGRGNARNFWKYERKAFKLS